jgi:hypothetical protein
VKRHIITLTTFTLSGALYLATRDLCALVLALGFSTAVLFRGR